MYDRDYFKNNGGRRARSDCTYMQADLALRKVYLW